MVLSRFIYRCTLLITHKHVVLFWTIKFGVQPNNTEIKASVVHGF